MGPFFGGYSFICGVCVGIFSSKDLYKFDNSPDVFYSLYLLGLDRGGLMFEAS